MLSTQACSSISAGRLPPLYANYKRRKGGLQIVPGAIVAALELGWTQRDEIIPAVARISRCRVATVSTLLEALAADDVADRLWARTPDARFVLVGKGGRQPFTVIAS